MGKKTGITWSPWFYDTLTGKFDTYPVTGRYPASSNFPKFIYIPKRKQFIVAGGGGVAFFDPAKKMWTGVKNTGVKFKGYDKSGCYDSKRERVYMVDQAYDIKTRA